MSREFETALDLEGAHTEFKEYHKADATLPVGQIGGDEGLDSNEEDYTDQDTRKLLKDREQEAPKESSSWVSFLTLEYYQCFFDITSAQVVHRVVAGMVPVKMKLVEVIRPNPDLYGPFWLCMTLIFTVAISGNISKFFGNGEAWEFHFHQVTIVGTAIYSYTWLVPVLIWSLLWWRRARDQYTLLELLCIYGYSIGIFIPITLLWVINIEALRWSLLCAGAVLSGTVLVLALWKPLEGENKKLAFSVLAVVFLMHAALAVSFKLYYFKAVAVNATTGSTERIAGIKPTVSLSSNLSVDVVTQA